MSTRLARYRGYFASPRLKIAAILCIAVGLAAVGALLTFARGVLSRPLPFPEQDRLVRVWVEEDGADRGRISLSYPLLQSLRGEAESFETFEGTARSRVLFFGGEAGRRVEGESVTLGYFDLLGLKPIVGRLFDPEEYEPGREGVMVISHQLWGTFFAFDEEVVGRQIRTDHGVFEVIGVLPSGFTGTVEEDAGEIEFWLPIRHYLSPERQARWDVGAVWGLGRLRQGTELEAAAAEIEAIGTRLAQRQPEELGGRSLSLEPMAENWREGLRAGTRLLFGAGFGLLLIACLNVSGLLLALALERRHDRAIRRALGAPQAVLIRHTLVETLALVGIGGVLGFLLGQGMLPWILEHATVELPDYVSPRADAVSTLAVFGVLLLTALVSGLLPALLEARVDPALALRERGHGHSTNRQVRSLWRGLVITQLALTMVLVFGSTVLIRSWVALEDEDLGFRTDGMLRIGLFIGPEDAPDEAQILPLARRVRADLETLPGVGGVALLWPTVPIWSPSEESIRWAGMPPSLEDRGLRVGRFAADPGWFDLMEIPVLAGRVFETRDQDPEAATSGTAVAVVSASLAERLGGTERTVGSEIEIGQGKARIIGVVEDAKLGGAKEDAAHRYELYLPLDLLNRRLVTVFVAAHGDPESLLPTLTRRVGKLAPSSALDWVATLDYALGQRYQDGRFAPLLLGLFSVAALIVTGVGIFALLAASVEGRRREIAIRKALGATNPRVMGRILSRSLALTGTGAFFGAIFAWMLARFLTSFVYGVEILDPWSFAAAAAILVAVGTLAAGLPAWHGSKIEPMHELREE